jgi:CheY-like chemotaxis protein
MRFCLDDIRKGQLLCDHHGEEFLSSKHAFDFAKATAQALRNSLNGDWIDWSVEVRDAEGEKYCSLPVVPARQAAMHAIAESDRYAKNRSSLLVIEDELIHSGIISRIAGRVGFTTTKAYSYADACNLLEAGQFDCITLDLGLGDHGGVDVLWYLSTIRCKAEIIVISQSDKDVCDDVVDLGRALDLSVYNSVLKPIDLDALRETLVHIQVQSLPRHPGPV